MTLDDFHMPAIAHVPLWIGLNWVSDWVREMMVREIERKQVLKINSQRVRTDGYHGTIKTSQQTVERCPRLATAELQTIDDCPSTAVIHGRTVTRDS